MEGHVRLEIRNMDTSAATSPPDPLEDVAETFIRAAVTRLASAFPPAMLLQVFSDRTFHLALPPGKRPRRNARIAREHTRLFDYPVRGAGDSGWHLRA